VPLVKTAALLAECLADELHLVVAPFFVGGSGAPRFASDARFPFDAAHPMAEPLELPGLTHLLHGQNPTLVAKGLAGFFTCHPIPESL
jgi:riboflavin biosynthesis pyrimidine reductase